jgi:hypothetical protein
VPASVAALIAIAITLGIYAPRQRVDQQRGRPSTSAAVAQPLDSTRELLSDGSGDDPSLAFVSDLASAIDLDGAADAGMAPDGSAEHAVTHMSSRELRELERLLQRELGAI